MAAEGGGMTLAQVQKQALELSHQERAELLDSLWDSMRPQGAAEVEAAWVMEAESRIHAVDRGDLPTVEGRAALDALRRDLRR